jgi:hypothetical protein
VMIAASDAMSAFRDFILLQQRHDESRATSARGRPRPAFWPGMRHAAS